MFRWLAGRGASRRRVARELELIPHQAWRATLARHPFLAGLSPQQEESLRHRAAWVLASKSFSGAQGFVPDDDVLLDVAVQAALPILELTPSLYEGWTEIILYPGDFLIPRSETDDAGVVHDYIMEASGEAWDGGPVILSWQAGEPASGGEEFPSRPVNVVIHEFAHKLDLYAGDADGIPYLGMHPDIKPRRWKTVLNDAFAAFDQALTAVEDAIPPDVDPESDAAAPWYDALPLDPYAATDEAEFFAVSSEAFFVDPAPLRRALPDWYALLAAYYRQDPLRRLAGRKSGAL